jgi:hypothetical protein
MIFVSWGVTPEHTQDIALVIEDFVAERTFRFRPRDTKIMPVSANFQGELDLAESWCVRPTAVAARPVHA